MTIGPSVRRLLCLSFLLMSCSLRQNSLDRAILPEVQSELRGRAFAPQVDATSLDEVPNGLTDCDKDFDTIRSKVDGDTSEIDYATSQFPETVLIRNERFNQYTISGTNPSGRTNCTGTVISPTWVITAAHCFLGAETRTHDVVAKGTNLSVSPQRGDVTIRAGGAVLLAGIDSLDFVASRTRNVIKIIIHRDYSADFAEGTAPHYFADLALVQFDPPFPEQAVPSARLVTEGGFRAAAAVFGYGFSDGDGGTVGRLAGTWPPTIVQHPTSGQMSFIPERHGRSVSAFCQGDSGAPVFASRYRGCKASDPAAESRPHVLEGIASYEYAGRATTGRTLGWKSIERCENAERNVMQDLTFPPFRNWICDTTGGAANGCLTSYGHVLAP